MKKVLTGKPAVALKMLQLMKKIRLTEEAIVEKYPQNKMRCPVHLCIGQEAIAAALGVLLRKSDFVLSTHRSHGHYLAKGGDLKKMIAEIYGKATGCSKGKGGSMHLVDKEAGFMGSTAIVGGTIPIAVGLGLSIKLRRQNQVSCVFLGDGAVEEGVFYESVNFAVLKKLPVLFICENNQYSVYTHLHARQPKKRKIYNMVRAMGCPADSGDGNNALEVYAKLKPALEFIRKGNGPYFFEFATYRWREHCGPNYDNDIGYRSQKEFLKWQKKDPVLALEKMLLRESHINQDKLDNISSGIAEEIRQAFLFAENSSFPEQSDISKHLYCQKS